MDRLFSEFKINQLTIPNRLAVAPMTRVSGCHSGAVGPLMQDYYQGFAKGGFGLIITEGLYTDQNYSQGYLNQPGISSQEHASGWVDLVQGVQRAGAKIIAQLMHAGALSQFNRFFSETAGPSSIRPVGEQMPFYNGSGPYSVPREMTLKDIDTAIEGFANSATLAKSAGFDGVEIHGANGYLLDQFLTFHTNSRSDGYGGPLKNRLKIFREVMAAVRAAVGSDFVVGVRISQKKVNDATFCWPECDAAAELIFVTLQQMGADYIHTAEPDLSAPAFPGGNSLAALAKKYSGLAVIANGGLVEPELARHSIMGGSADMIALGKIALANQDWPERVKNNHTISPFDFSMLSPKASLENAKHYFERQEVLA